MPQKTFGDESPDFSAFFRSKDKTPVASPSQRKKFKQSYREYKQSGASKVNREQFFQDVFSRKK